MAMTIRGKGPGGVGATRRNRWVSTMGHAIARWPRRERYTSDTATQRE